MTAQAPNRLLHFNRQLGAALAAGEDHALEQDFLQFGPANPLFKHSRGITSVQSRRMGAAPQPAAKQLSCHRSEAPDRRTASSKACPARPCQML